MTDIQQKIQKKDKQIFFQVQFTWLSKLTGSLTSPDVPGSIQVATPPAFGGDPGEWSPEDLFLGAISSCFMATYLVFARKSGLEVTGIKCESIGQVELLDGSYKFTTVNVYPRISIKNEDMRELAEKALAKTQKHCLIANSISADIIYHGEVLVDMPHIR